MLNISNFKPQQIHHSTFVNRNSKFEKTKPSTTSVLLNAAKALRERASEGTDSCFCGQNW